MVPGMALGQLRSIELIVAKLAIDALGCQIQTTEHEPINWVS